MTVKQLQQQKQVLIDYLLMKVEQRDYHGIRDCCVDIEVLEAKIAVVEQLEEFKRDFGLEKEDLTFDEAMEELFKHSLEDE